MHAQPFQELTFPISNAHRMKNKMHDDAQHPVAFMYTTHYGSIGYPVATCRSSFPTYQNLKAINLMSLRAVRACIHL